MIDAAAVAVERVGARGTVRDDLEVSSGSRAWAVCVAAVLGVSLAVRLGWMFLLSDPENPGVGVYDDAFHHWQIAYLTETVGVHDGPRLWDLKGMEYFWGIVQPLLLTPLLAILHSSDIVVERLLSIASGVTAIGLLMALCRRYWGTRVAIAAGVIAALTPGMIVTDASGMVEPLSLLLLLFAVWLAESGRLWSCGLVLGLAAATRVEDLAIGGAVLVVVLARPESKGQRAPLIGGWGLALGGYLWVLHNQTGDWFYAFRQNAATNAGGTGLTDATTTGLRPVFLGLAAVAAFALIAVLWQRPPSMAFLALGLASWLFIATAYGATHYIVDWKTWFWAGRHLAFPTVFVAVAAVAGADLLARRAARVDSRRLAAAVVLLLVAVAGALQLQWRLLLPVYAASEPHWQFAAAAGATLRDTAATLPLRDGRVNIPAGSPELTYALVRAGVDGTHIVGQLYDPFGGSADLQYGAHPGVDDQLLGCWLRATQTRVWVVTSDRTDYLAFAQGHGAAVHRTGTLDGYGHAVFVVDPGALPSGCS